MPTPTPDAPTPSPRPPAPLRVLLIVGGTGSLALGILGMFLPVLPTTPFVLLAAGCYAHAWPGAHRWLRNNRVFGPICRGGEEGHYLPRRAKWMALGFTAASFAATLFFGPKTWWVRGPVLLIGVIVMTWLARLPTRPKQGAQSHS